MRVYGKYFYGHEISEYGQQNGYVDYWTLSKAFQHVLSNDIHDLEAMGAGIFARLSGGYDDEVYQWYIIDRSGAELLQRIDEVVEYNEALDMYIWGVTHWGTAWDYVLTDIPCNTGEV